MAGAQRAGAGFKPALAPLAQQRDTLQLGGGLGGRRAATAKHELFALLGDTK